jgi:hypothetical protein
MTYIYNFTDKKHDIHIQFYIDKGRLIYQNKHFATL